MGDQTVHPSDHVNQGQSSNDVIPTAIHVAAMDGIGFRRLPALEELQLALAAKAEAFTVMLKIGRTHLQDATPLTLGQEFSGYAGHIAHGLVRLRQTQVSLGELPPGHEHRLGSGNRLRQGGADC